MSRYRYLPWVRQGAAHAYDNPDTPEPVLARGDNKPLSALPVALLVNDSTRVDVPLRLYGPGDVVGIDPRAVLRTDPLRHTADFEPNYLACIEFDVPDFPWLFTPAAAGASGRLRPWLVLVVVPHAEDMPSRPTGDAPLPAIEVPVGQLPDLAESWAWAHAQVVELDGSQTVEHILGSEPGRNLSRLVSPRRLEPETRYLACVVPAFEAGRKAGLGLDVTASDEDRLGPAWTAAQPSVRLPVYYHWEFATGSGGDFETLARRLEPRPAGDVGRRKLHVGRQPFGLPDAGVLQLEGALVAPGELQRPAPSAAFRKALRELLDPGRGDPVVAPPVYGSWQAARSTVPGDTQTPVWLRELNLDPSARAVAGLGALVVQEAQEQLVASAWEQLGDPDAVVTLERRLEVAVAVLDSVVRRRVEPMETGRLVQFLGPAHARLRMSPQTLHASLAGQNLPSSFSSTSFRRLVTPGGTPTRRGSNGSTMAMQALATSLGSLVPIVGAPPTAPGLVTQTELVQQVNKTPRTAIPRHLRYLQAASAVRDYVNTFFGLRSIPLRRQFTFEQSFKATLVEKLDPRQTAPARFYARVSSVEGAVEPPALPGDSVLFTPSFPQPMYEALRDLSPELLLPGVGTIEADTVTLLNDNPRFIEAYMVGLNHELASELLWREFPSDMRSSYFPSFWDTRGTPSPMGQLPAVHTWDPAAALGKSYGGGATNVVLLLRGELLYRYPDALIYAVRAKTLRALGTQEKLPLFRGRIDPDITFLGFDLTEAAARGEGTDPGWFFVIQEQPTAPRFGLDEQRGNPLDTWNDLAWNDLATPPGSHLTLVSQTPSVASPGGVEWGLNAAHMAAILRQRPVRIAIHARQLLPPG
jgi:hypothetical protein